MKWSSGEKMVLYIYNVVEELNKLKEKWYVPYFYISLKRRKLCNIINKNIEVRLTSSFIEELAQFSSLTNVFECKETENVIKIKLSEDMTITLYKESNKILVNYTILISNKITRVSKEYKEEISPDKTSFNDSYAWEIMKAIYSQLHYKLTMYILGINEEDMYDRA